MLLFNKQLGKTAINISRRKFGVPPDENYKEYILLLIFPLTIMLKFFVVAQPEIKCVIKLGALHELKLRKSINEGFHLF